MRVALYALRDLIEESGLSIVELLDRSVNFLLCNGPIFYLICFHHIHDILVQNRVVLSKYGLIIVLSFSELMSRPK